ncbi:hypothetical protein NCPPB940_31350 [Xanthomonas hortorum pv. taraxaci]|nr:hypothetical protein NCPPB940_31350 [Xanthomonas hortorum pv. taraxaci]CAD0345907.1 hypothetical protein NCPPB940_31350 [Xanthomonas hortorum pv. taraxaci]
MVCTIGEAESFTAAYFSSALRGLALTCAQIGVTELLHLGMDAPEITKLRHCCGDGVQKRQEIARVRRHPDQLVRYRPRYCNLFAVIALAEYVCGLSTRRIAEVSIRGDCVCSHRQPTCSHCHDMPRQRELRVEARCSETFLHRQGLAAGADVFNTQSYVVRCPVHDIGPGVQKVPTRSARRATGTVRPE